MALINTNLAHWAQMGLMPITFGHLLSGCDEKDVAGAMSTIKGMMGEQIWERFFNGVDVTLSLYVPFQLGSILNTALSRAEAVLRKCAKEWDFLEKAEDHFSVLLEEDAEAKRQRTGRYAPSPY